MNLLRGHLYRLVTWSMALNLALSCQVATAAIVGLNSGITVDASLNVTGITVPGGKSFATPLVTANSAGYLLPTVNLIGEIIETADPNTLQGGTAHNLNLNAPAGSILIGNGYGYADLSDFGGNTLVTSRDADAAQQDFLLSDYGGNDDFGVAAILVDGTVGEIVYIDPPTFGKIQYNDPNTGNPLGQATGFLAFDVSDLLDGSGNPLPPNAVLRGVRIYENQIPDPSGPQQGLDLVLFVADVVAIPEPTSTSLTMILFVALLVRRVKVD